MRLWGTIALAATVMFAAAPAHARDHVVQLTYAAPERVVRGEPSIDLGDVTDGREHERTWLGAIRTALGNAVKVLHTRGPVSDTVGTAIRDGLAARNLLASNDARHRLNVHVLQFDCDQVARREAHIHLQLRLVDAVTGILVHEYSARAEKTEGSMFSLGTGIFVSHEDLRELANEVLQSAVDQALDDPGFRAALARPPGPPLAATAEVASTGPSAQ